MVAVVKHHHPETYLWSPHSPAHIHHEGEAEIWFLMQKTGVFHGIMFLDEAGSPDIAVSDYRERLRCPSHAIGLALPKRLRYALFFSPEIFKNCKDRIMCVAEALVYQHVVRRRRRLQEDLTYRTAP